jgi:hypothetical protein
MRNYRTGLLPRVVTRSPNACRIRTNACCKSPRLCVRNLVCESGFPLVNPLPSTTSADRGAPPPLFGSFLGTMRLSDFPRPFIAAVLPRDSQRGPCFHSARSNVGPPGSRAKSIRTCSGSLTTQGLVASRANDTTSVAFRFRGQRRHPEVYYIFCDSIVWPARCVSPRGQSG